jgi:adenylyltransferase/sulfurtransferase
VIEEIKLRLPVWKNEHYSDGTAEWVNCTAEAAARHAGDGMHARQVALPEVGAAGQARLAAGRVLIVGVGGLGCPAALYLAGAGLGRLTLVDGGKVEHSNLPRQVLFTRAEVGAPKALAAVARLRQHSPASHFTSHGQDLTAQNARTLVAGQDVVLDCTDNFTARFVLHDACRALGVPLVSAAVHRFEGTLDVFRHDAGGCLHCQWAGRSAAELDTAGNCAGGPVFGPTVGVLGVMQAAEAIKLLLGHEGDAPRQTRLVNLLDGTQLTIAREARPGCPVCSRVDAWRLAKPAPDDDAAVRPLLLDSAGIAGLGATARTVYLTEPDETPPVGVIAVPSQDLARLREFAASGPLVLSCRHGVRSAALARLLRSEGAFGVYALTA